MEEDQIGSQSFSTNAQRHEISTGEWLDKLCIYYMGCGISYDEFWYGDYTRFHYYEELEKQRQRQQNYYAWLQGVYMTQALYASVGNMFKAKSSSPISYPSEPFPLGSEDIELAKERERRKKEQDIKNKMMMFATRFNSQRKEKTDGK